MITRNTKFVTSLDAVIAVTMALGSVWFFRASFGAAAEAKRLYGHSIDAGAIEGITAMMYFLPNAALFLIASAAIWWQWRIRWLVQIIAVCWLIGPVIFAIVDSGV
jgi:hypothetical protein